MIYGLRMDRRPNRVFCLISDRKHNEGNLWEAVMFTAKNKPGNLIAILDRNYIQIDGNTEDVMPFDPVKEKYSAFNWTVIEIDGNNIEEIFPDLPQANKLSGKPTMVVNRQRIEKHNRIAPPKQPS